MDALQRSHMRVYQRLCDDAPYKGAESVRCPFCDRALIVRRSVLGFLADVGGQRPHIDGVRMKCAGDDGCGFRPDFDVPITRSEWEWELERRPKVVDAGYTETDERTIEERLTELGYIVE